MPQNNYMLKKTSLLFALSLCLCFVSCKKHHACQCVSTFTKAGYNSFTVSSIENIDKKVTKKRGGQMCLQAEKQMQKNHEDYISGNEKVTVSCALK